MVFGDKNPADVLKDPMWQMFQTFGQKADIPALERYVYSLIHMATQKDAGQDGFNGKKRTEKNISFETDLNMVLWGIVIEACALVLSGELERMPTAQPERQQDEGCTDCEEYDNDKHCCPRISKMIWDMTHI